MGERTLPAAQHMRTGDGGPLASLTPRSGTGADCAPAPPHQRCHICLLSGHKGGAARVWATGDCRRSSGGRARASFHRGLRLIRSAAVVLSARRSFSRWAAGAAGLRRMALARSGGATAATHRKRARRR
eukprot:2019509-Prymnesium_polylepis.1